MSAPPERTARAEGGGHHASDVFALADRHRLPQFTMTYCRPPDRVSRIQTRVLSIDANAGRWLTDLAPKAALRFDGEVVMDRGYWAVWFISNGASYDLGKVYSTDGRHTGYYLDVLEPVRWRGDALATIEPLTDLFLDLWVAPDGRWQVLDEPEFQEAEERGWLTPLQAAHARGTLERLVELALAGTLVTPAIRSFELRI